MTNPNASPSRRSRTPTGAGFFVGPALFVLAGWLVWGPDLVELPQGTAVAVDPARLSTAPRRQALADPPTIDVEGARRTCMDCHRLFQPSEAVPDRLIQHRHIVVHHGINDRCRNCHDTRDRDKLVLWDGTAIPFAESHRLCGKCHGPTYRDWERGSHGRTNGSWDTASPALERLKCSQCHDPHDPRRPAMDPIEPLPGPRLAGPAPGADDAPAAGTTSSRSTAAAEGASPHVER